jgi:hypothetical protein
LNGLLPARRLLAIFVLKYHPHAVKPAIEQISTGVAAARLVSHILNSLAHSANGLDAASKVIKQPECFELYMADLKDTFLLVWKFLR